MNFEYSEEQTMIKDSVERFVREEYGFDVRRQIIASDDGYSREYWAKFAELGWLSIPFAEQYGGYGGSVDDVAAIMEALGKGNVVEPFQRREDRCAQWHQRRFVGGRRAHWRRTV